MNPAAAPAPAPRGAMPRPPRFGIFQLVILLGNVCGSGAFSFPIVFTIAFVASYLIRVLRPEQASLLISTPVFLVAYYLCIGAYRLLVYNRKFDPLLAVPGPRGHWITGMNQAILQNEAAVPQRTWIREYDNPLGILAYTSLGVRRLLPYTPASLSFFLNSPNYVKPPRTNNFIKTMIGGGILTAEYDEHKRQRRILTPAFAIGHIRKITPHFWAKAHQLADVLIPVAQTQPPEGIDVTKWINRATLDIIGLAGFGFDFDSLTSEDQEISSTYRKLFQPDAATRISILLRGIFPPFKYLPFRANVELDKARKTIRDTALSMIRLKQAQGNDTEGRGERDILGVMIEENRKNRESGLAHDALSEEEMVNQVMTFLAAGYILSGRVSDLSHETTSTTVTWGLYLLSIHQDVQERLRKEVRSVNLRDAPSFEKLESMKYLNNVCREVLRFSPVVAMTIREADKDDYYQGIKIPGGTPVFIAPGVMNFDERMWGPDAGIFNPDRWDSLPDTISNYSFMTFIQGHRSCIGRKFAEAEMKCLVSVLVANYTFYEVVPGRRVEKESIITVRPKGGMPLRVVRVDP